MSRQPRMSPKTFGILMGAGLFGFSVPTPESIARQEQVNKDGALIQELGVFIQRMNKEQHDLMFQAFEYITPTGLNCRPLPDNLRTKLVAMRDVFNQPRG